MRLYRYYFLSYFFKASCKFGIYTTNWSNNSIGFNMVGSDSNSMNSSLNLILSIINAQHSNINWVNKMLSDI